MKPTDVKHHLSALLWDKKTEDAQRFMEEVLKIFEDMAPPKPTKAQVPAATPIESGAVQQSFKSSPAKAIVDSSDRNKAILDIAKAALNSEGYVEISRIAEIAAAQGIQMQVSDNRVNTAIATILRRTGGYSKVRDGAYKPPH